MSPSQQGVKDMVLAVLECVDDRVPYVGVLMDIPEVDAVEKQVVDAVVDALADVVRIMDSTDKIMSAL